MSDAANPLLNSLIAARTLLRDCFHWRALGGATPWTQEQAESRIYFDELPPPVGDDYTAAELTALRPFALMWLDLNGGLRLSSDVSGSHCWTPSGTAIVQIELPVPDNLKLNPRALALDMHTKLGRILRTGNPNQPGLADLAGLPGCLPLKEIIYRGYIRTDEKGSADIGDCIRCEIELQWSAM